MKYFAAFWAVVGVLIGSILLAAANYAISGWAISTLWNWYAAPFLHAPPLGILPAVGLLALAQVFLDRDTGTKDTRTDSERLRDYLVVAFVVPLFAVLVGWIVLHFMGG